MINREKTLQALKDAGLTDDKYTYAAGLGTDFSFDEENKSVKFKISSKNFCITDEKFYNIIKSNINR